MNLPLRAVVTAGGTSEPVDDVRVLTNLSTGRFGAAIANALVARGVDVLLLASRRALDSRSVVVDPRVRRRAFGSFADLAQALEEAGRRERPDLVLMAAAVSDYSPVRAAGKLSSADAERSLLLEKNPKLLDRLREWCGEGATLVGFKLLSGVERGELERVARAQLVRAGLDVCVANDLADLRDGRHPVLVVEQERTRPLTGPRGEVADALAGLLVERALGSGSLGARPPEVAPAPPLPEAGAAVAAALGQAPPPPRPLLAANLSTEVAFVRLQATAAPTARSPLAPPPGSAAEAEAVLDALRGAARSGRYAGAGFAAALGDGSLLCGWTARQAQALPGEWAALRQRAQATGLDPEALRPVLSGPLLVGAEAASAGERRLALTPLDLDRLDALADRLDAQGERVLLPAGETLAPWLERGWRREEGPAGWSALLPASRRDDLRPAVSVGLLDPIGRRVLLGRRLGPRATGAWAFPGGRQEEGEDPLATAARELREETGLRLPPGPPDAVVTVVAGAGEEAYRIVHLRYTALRAEPPRPSEELEARWVPLEEALDLEPLTAGTRRVLRELLTPPPA